MAKGQRGDRLVPVVVFVHGLLVSGTLWRKVTPELSRRYRCIVPDWPLGSHTVAMNADADVSPEGVAGMVGELLAKLDLHDVTLVGNDSGGAITQLVAARHGARVSRVVLTTCDAFEIFPPALFRYLTWIARSPLALAVLAKSLVLFPALRRLPIAYGIVAKHPIDSAVVEAWTKPSASDPAIRRDLAKFLRGLRPEVTMQVANELRGTKKPFLLVWTPEDRSFPLSLAHRLKEIVPDSRLILVDDAFVFLAEDQPGALATAIAGFVPALRDHAVA